MTEPSNRYEELSQLIFGSLEGTLDAAQASRLQSLISTQEWALKYYCEYITLYSDLKIPRDISVFSSSRESVLDPRLWERLGEDEKKAEAVTIPAGEDETQEKEITKIGVKKAPRKINKVSLYTVFLAVAALVMMFVYVYLNPRKSMEVATLADSINAQWTSWLPLSKNVRLTIAPEPIKLQRGIIKLVTDEDVQILIESPAEFRFVSASQIVMKQGRLFATVSQTGRGFTVQTANSKVTDLGTEFGVLADSQGTTELHVFKGKTVFIGETKNKVKNVLEALGGQALRLEQQSDSVKNIALNDNAFVRSIDSQANLLWRGQKRINMADIIGKGDGFGTGKTDFGIDPRTGKFDYTTSISRKVANTYTAVGDSVFVDGVFVPNGQSEQVVSSVGHIFAECPFTHGRFYASALNTPSQFKGLPLFLDDVNYSLPQNPCIFMHSNLGVTFDLNAFRSRLPGARIAQFQSHVGVSSTAPGPFSVDVWVLIDGQVRYKKMEVSRKGPLDLLKIDIREQDSFLTLIVTEGKNTEDNADYSRSSIGCDWVLFGGPVLILE